MMWPMGSHSIPLKPAHASRDAGRLRIAVVTETFPPEINGVAMTTGRMVEGLLDEGHTILLARPRQGREDRPAALPHFHEVLVRGLPIPMHPGLKLGLPARALLVREWARCRPDVVVIVTEGPLGWSALRAARRLQLPVVSEFHTNFHRYSGHYGLGWLHGSVAGYLRRFHNRSDTTLVPTDEMRRTLASQGYRNVRVISRGVDTRLFDPARRSDALRLGWDVPDGEPAVLYVGRIAPEKNLALVVDAFEAIRARRPRARMVWVGDGPERARLAARYPDHVFAGMRRGTDLAAHYASADLFLFPSATETYGNVTVEAMASGLAVVAFDYASAAERIRSGENGWLAPLGDAAAFVTAAVRGAVDAQALSRLRQQARLSVEPLEWRKVVADFRRVLEHVAAERLDSSTPEAAAAP